MPDSSQRRSSYWLAILVTLSLTGCQKPVTSTTDAPKYPTVRLLVVDDPALATAIKREWQASGQPPINLTEATSEEVAKSSSLAADCVIYPAPLMGELATAGKIVALPDEALSDSDVQIGDVFPLIRLRELSWGDAAYAVPFGSPQLVLLYRSDVFERVDRSPPQTWHELLDVAEQLNAPAVSETPPDKVKDWHALAMPIKKGWASQFYLSIAAPYVHDPQRRDVLFDGQTMEPLIDREPYVRALDEMSQLHRFASSNCLEMSPAEATSELLAGRCAIAISWLSPADPKPATGIKISAAPLPGVTQTYSINRGEWDLHTDVQRTSLLTICGRVGSITSTARHTRGASNTLIWLANPSNASRLAAQSTQSTLFRYSSTADAQAWVSSGISAVSARQFAEVIQEGKSREAWIMSLRLRGKDRYLQPLDEAIQKTLTGEQPADESLAEAAASWRRITEELGKQQQHDSYLRSLGIAP